MNDESMLESQSFWKWYPKMESDDVVDGLWVLKVLKVQCEIDYAPDTGEPTVLSWHPVPDEWLKSKVEFNFVLLPPLAEPLQCPTGEWTGDTASIQPDSSGTYRCPHCGKVAVMDDDGSCPDPDEAVHVLIAR